MGILNFSYGGIDEVLIKGYISEFAPNFYIPPDLLHFWVKLGGGDFYETETFLYPLYDEVKENITRTNMELWRKGLGRDYLVFYIGSFGYGALKKDSNGIFLLKNTTFVVDKKLDNFLVLIKLINTEFNERYEGSLINF